MADPLISLIIVNWNGGEVFRNCLSSLADLTYPNWELILVDNGSTDGSEELLWSIKLPTKHNELIKNKINLGFAKANNQGYKKSKGKYILLLNNDTKVSSDLLSKLVNRIEQDPKLGVVQPKILLMDKPNFLDNAGSFLTKIGFLDHWGFGQRDGKEFTKEKEIFSAKGACMLIRRSVIDQVKLFDSDFVSYFEESDFCWRVWLSGFKVLFYPKTYIYHKVGFTIRRLNVTELNYHYSKNRICSLIKNLEIGNFILILTPHLIISMALITLFIYSLQFKYALMIAKAFWWNLKNLSKTLRKRNLIQSSRKLTDRELFSHILKTIKWKKFLNDYKRIQEDLARPQS